MEQTNIEKIIDMSKILYDAVPIREITDPKIFGLKTCNHPFLNSTITIFPGESKYVDLTERKNAERLKDLKFSGINSLSLIFFLVEKGWKMTWFKYCHKYMDIQTFSEYLVACWTYQDNPNNDVNVSRKEALSYFKKAKKQYMMNEDELEHLHNLPDVITLWRGVAPKGNNLGLSWTDNEKVALKFKKRFEYNGKKGKLLKAEVPKRYIVAYFNERNEDEYIIDVFKIKGFIKEC